MPHRLIRFDRTARTARTAPQRWLRSVLHVLLGMSGLWWAGASAGAQASTTPPDSVAPAADSTVAALGPRLGFSAFTHNYNPAVVSAHDTTFVASPTLCVAAALRMESHATRTAAAQRAQLIIHADTLPLAPATVQMARACGAPWTAANTVPVELPGLFRLALLANQDATAHAAGARWTQLAGSTDTARGQVLFRQLQWVANTRPRTQARLSSVQQLAAQIAALNPTAVVERIQTLGYLGQLAGMTGHFAQQIAILDSIRTLVRHLPSADQRRRLAGAMLGSAITESQDRFLFPFDLHSKEFHAEIERGLAAAERDIDTVDTKRQFRHILPQTFDGFMYTPAGVRNDSLVITMNVQPAPPLQVQHWYGRPDTSVTYPRHGVLTFVMRVHVCIAGSSTQCARTYVAWRHLYATFASRGVDFILLTETTGSFGLSTLLSPAAEVDSLRAYFQDQLKLPGILGIRESTFTTLPDGRKVPQASPLYDGFVTRDGLHWEGENIGYTAGYEKAVAFLDNQLTLAASQP